MTQRERQILQMITENPMISQEDLAKKAGISRSAAAVHISNLVKKGYIAGKGYILKSGTYAAVVGGVNIDIMGQSFNPLIAKDSNPGFSRTALGGVGRNIAHNLSLLDVDVRFLTAFGEDHYADVIEESCGELGIDISHALKVKGARSSTYMFINGPDGDMALAVSDMAICDQITPRYLSNNATLLNNAQIVVLDTNIPEDSIGWLCDHCTRPLFADPVSVSKAKKLIPYLGKIHTLKPNRLEAEVLSGVKIDNEEDLKKAAAKLLETGLERVFISCGTDGVLCADHNEIKMIPCIKADAKNSTGAGDAFMAGLAWSYLQNASLDEAGLYATAASSIAVEGEETINPQMSVANLKKKIQTV